MGGRGGNFLGEMIQPKSKWTCPGIPSLFVFFFSVREGALSFDKFHCENRGYRFLRVRGGVLSFDKFHDENRG